MILFLITCRPILFFYDNTGSYKYMLSDMYNQYLIV